VDFRPAPDALAEEIVRAIEHGLAAIKRAQIWRDRS
jgi:hypothetical protein